MSSKKIIKITGFSIFFVLIIVYALFRSQDLIFGVKIKNVTINGLLAQASAKTDSNILRVTGNAKNAKNLILNGREISIDENGDFNETIALLSGYNIITIVAKDKFGYVDEKNYKIIKSSE